MCDLFCAYFWRYFSFRNYGRGNSPQVCFVLLLVLQNSISLYSGCNRVGWLYYIHDIPTFEKVVAYVYEVQAATGKMFDQNVSYIEMSPELSEIAANINQLKQEAESNARLAKENEQRKNDLIMYLAHDLKTPLSSVIGYLTLLRDESQISKELREKYLSITLGKAERLEDLINEFFEITRFNIYDITLQYTKINLTRLLEQLVYEFKPMLKSKNLQCNLCVDDDIMLRCDADKIQRVFDNLLRNAVIYSLKIRISRSAHNVRKIRSALFFVTTAILCRKKS